ncbi:MAG: TrkA family potassium uptake protein [Clostridia bacterium]|nr:TrkA family potassium uptake protein [Clostridia bacterium]
MKSVLLIGLGLFGQKIALELNKLNHEVMAVDTDEEKINRVLPYVTDAQIGDATDENFLSSLGVSDYDVCFVTIGDDFQNSLETTSLLKDLGARRVVARASDDVHRKFLLRNGADEVVYPEGQLAAWTVMRYTTEHVKDFIDLDGEYDIYEIQVPDEWSGKTVGGLDIRKKYNLNLLAVREDGKPSMGVSSDTLLLSGQTIFVLGKWKDIQKCFKD